MPNSMLDPCGPRKLPSSSLPSTQERMEPERRKGRRAQIQVPTIQHQEYLPQRIRRTVIMNVTDTDFQLTRDCQIRIEEVKKEVLIFACIKQNPHDCTKKPGIKVMLRQSSPKPTEKAAFFHLRVIHR